MTSPIKPSFSSLESLQALEKTNSDFVAQLNDLVTIIGSSLRTTNPIIKTSVHSTDGRLDWAFRWLLNKFRASNEEGRIARASTQAWTLLSDILERLQASFISRSLISSKFLTIVEETAKEACLDSRNAMRGNDNQAEKIEALLSEDITLPVGSIDDASIKPSKKRKRGKEAEAEADTDASIARKQRRAVENGNNSLAVFPTTPCQTPLERLHVIDACFRKLRSMIDQENKTMDSYSKHHMQSILRINSAQAAHLLSYWLRMRLTRKDSTMSEQQRKSVMLNLSNVILIWKLSVSSLAEASDIVMLHFAEYCLVPATAFLSLERRKRVTSPVTITESDDVCQIEALLAQHIFVPGKARFRETNQDIVSDTTYRGKQEAFLSALIKPLHTQLRNQDNGSCEENALVDSTAVPLLFEICLKTSSLSKSKQRAAESPWIQAVFVALSACLGIAVDDAEVRNHSTSDLKALDQLLELALHNKVMFKSDFVEKMSNKFLKSSLEADEVLPWPIISQLIAMDPNIFVPPRWTSDNRPLDESTGLWSYIFPAITKEAWISKQFTVRHEQEPKFDTSVHLAYQRYMQIKDGVVISLMKAYITARDVGGFLIRWQTELKLFLEEQFQTQTSTLAAANHIVRFSVWQDPDLDKELAKVLNTSLTASQLTDLLRDFASNFEVDTLHSVDTRKAAQMTSGLHMVDVMLKGISDHTIIRTLAEQVLGIILRCVMLLESHQVKAYSLISNIWRLLTTCHRLLLLVANLALIDNEKIDYEAIMKRAFQSLQRINNLKTWNEFEVGLQAVNCLGGISNDLRERQMTNQQMSKLAINLLEPLHRILVESNPENDNLEALYFASVLTKYPELLDWIKPENVEQRKDKLEMLQKLGCILLNSIDLGDSNSWQDFVRHSEDEARSVVEAISRNTKPRTQSSTVASKDDSLVFKDAYFAIEPKSIPRPNRQQILDDAAATLQNVTCVDALIWSRELSLMIRLLEFPSGSAMITSSAECLWKIAQILDTAMIPNQDDEENWRYVMRLFKQLSDIVLQYHATLKSVTQHRPYVEEAWDTAKTWLTEQTVVQSKPASLSLYIALSQMLPSSSDGQQNGIVLENDKLISRLCSELADQLEQAKFDATRSAKDFSVAITLLGAIADLEPHVLLRQEKLVEFTIKAWATRVFNTRSVEHDIANARLATMVFRASCNIKTAQSLPPNILEALFVSRQSLSTSERELNHQAFMKTFSATDESIRGEILGELLLGVTLQSNDSAKLVLLHALVSAGSHKPYNTLLPSTSIPHITTTISESLRLASTYESFHDQSSMLIKLLFHHSKSQSQLAVDSALLAVTTACSPAGPALQRRHAPQIFSALARISLALLTHHRRALRGRFDLVILALEALLRCLFVPLTGSAAAGNAQTVSLRAALAPWSATTPQNALTAVHAKAYTRLLTTLCDPTLASVRVTTFSSSESTMAALNDVTQKARHYAGQYAHLILLEVCRCMLAGRLGGDGDVRHALLVGVWAVFGVVDKEVLVAAAEGMGSAERSVLRGLREEWRRVGGGGGSRASGARGKRA